MNQKSYIVEALNKALIYAETFVVLLIVGILFSVAYNAMDPLKKFSEIRDMQRNTDIRQLLNSLYDYKLNNPQNEIVKLVTKCPDYRPIGTENDMINLEKLLVPDYIIRIPVDPLSESFTNTGYGICTKDNGRLSAIAFKSEQKTIILDL